MATSYLTLKALLAVMYKKKKKNPTSTISLHYQSLIDQWNQWRFHCVFAV